MSHPMTKPRDIAAFALAGNATLTIRSAASGVHYTYRIRAAENNPTLFFVSALTGSDNENSYTYMGIVSLGDGGAAFRLTKKSHFSDDSTIVKAFRYFWQHVVNNCRIPSNLSVYHEDRCGRCNRKLTTPESIERGIGPECASIMAEAA